MSDVLIRQVESIGESNFVLQEEQELYLKQHKEIENNNIWMTLDETIAVCCNIIQEIIKITERFRFKHSKNLF